MKNYYIKAESRATGTRERFTGNMTETEAREWVATYLDKKTHKYFRPVRDEKVKE